MEPKITGCVRCNKLEEINNAFLDAQIALLEMYLLRVKYDLQLLRHAKAIEEFKE